jgi:hypothetical protein
MPVPLVDLATLDLTRTVYGVEDLGGNRFGSRS